MDSRKEWSRARDRLTGALVSLGFPEELGDIIAKHIGSPRGIDRMVSYLDIVRPQSMELIADEMIAIRSDIDRWRDKKQSEHANAVYNGMLNCPYDDEDE